MNRLSWPRFAAMLLALLCLLALPTAADAQQAIPPDAIADLQTQLAEAKESSSAARQKLGIRRVIRASEQLLEKHPAAPNRFEVLGVLYQTQQEQIKLDDSTKNRRAFLDTCRALAQAPNAYAALRLDADLLLSQAELAQQGADQQARADALKPFVQRYLGTDVETRVVRIALVMAIELGDASLIAYLRNVIAEHFPGDQELINFQRDQLAGQVFGAPFVGTFTSANEKTYRFPMDSMGKATALYFWSKDDGGIEQIKAMAEGWAQVPAEKDGPGRYQFISFNLDNLPDAGESLLREAGIDWPALHLPGGRENPIYKTYVRNDPKLLTLTPSGYAAIVMSGATRKRPDRSWDQIFQSSLARSWTDAQYNRDWQYMLAGDFLVIDPTGEFDPAAPPEWKALVATDSQLPAKLVRTDQSVPAEKLEAIQACFVKPPARLLLQSDEVRANYAKAEALCREVIAEHPDADDLWIVRNRLIVSLMARWKAEGKREHFDAALRQASAALEAGYPEGTDVIARFCLARELLRNAETDSPGVIDAFVSPDGNQTKAASAQLLASLLALEIGDRKLHEHYRRAFLDQHAQTPALWNATSFLVDRYHRYWLYHPPFTAGWTYGRRQKHFLNIGTPEDADRSLRLQLKTLEGQTVQIPEDAEGKWTLIEFHTTAAQTPHLIRYGAFVDSRPVDDVQRIVAVLDDDVATVRETYQARQEDLKSKRRSEDPFPTMIVPGGLDNPIVQQLGIVPGEKAINIAVIRPDGSIAAMLDNHSNNAMQNIIEWHDEKAVEAAIARGDLEAAKRIAFIHAPLTQQPPPDAPKNWKPRKIDTVHLRARAKLYAAIGEWEAAKADAHEAYLAINSQAGYLSMRTDDLEAIEQLKAEIETRLQPPSESP